MTLIQQICSYFVKQEFLPSVIPTKLEIQYFLVFQGCAGVPHHRKQICPLVLTAQLSSQLGGITFNVYDLINQYTKEEECLANENCHR